MAMGPLSEYGFGPFTSRPRPTIQGLLGGLRLTLSVELATGLAHEGGVQLIASAAPRGHPPR